MSILMSFIRAAEDEAPAPSTNPMAGIDWFNGTLIISVALAVLVVIVLFVAAKVMAKSDKQKVSKTLEFGGNVFIVFALVAFVVSGSAYLLVAMVVNDTFG